MKKKIKYLILEDNPYDAKLVQFELQKLETEYDSKIVSTRQKFKEAIDTFEPDFILSDYSLGPFNGLEALEIAKHKCPAIPFVIVTGSLSEETAVACMKKGAWDYVLKDKLFKLESAIDNAFKLKKEIDHTRKIEKDLLLNQFLLTKAQEIGSIGSWELDLTKNELIWTEQNYKNFGVPVGTPLTYEIFLNFVHPQDREYVNEEWNAAIKGKPYDIQHRLLVDNRLKWVREKADFVFDEKGKAIKAIGFTQDITKRILAETELLNTEEKYRIITHASLDIIFILDKTGKLLFSNESMKRILGYQQNDYIGKSFTHFVPKKEIPKYIKKLADIFKHKEIRDFYSQVYHKDGHLIDVEINGKLVRHEGKLAAQGTIRDISERKQAEIKLRKSEKRFRSMFESHSAVMLLIEADSGRILDSNNSAINFYGYSHKELSTMSIDDINTLKLEEVKKRRKEAETKKVNFFEFRHRLKNDTIRDVQVHSTPIEYMNQKLLFSIIYDITERKVAENALLESRERFDLAMKASKDGLYDWNLITNEVYYSPGWKSMLGYEYDELPNEISVWEELIDPEGLKRVSILNQKLFNKQLPRIDVNFKMKHKSGHWVDILSRSEVIFDQKDKALRMIGTHSDITERKKLEHARLDSEKKYLNLFENSSEFLFTLDLKGNFSDVNKTATVITGYTKAELLTMNFKDYIDRKEHRKLFRAFYQIYKSGQPFHNLLIEAVMKDKSKRHFAISLNLYLQKNEVIGYQGSSIDVTERTKLENMQKTLFLISDAVSKTSNINELYAKIRDIIGNIIDTANFYVALYDKETDFISFGFYADETHEDVNYLPTGRKLGMGLTDYVIKTGKSLFATNEEQEELSKLGKIELIGSPSDIWMGVPLEIENNLIGVMAVQCYNNPNLYSKEDLEILNFISEEIALAINHKQAEEALKQKMSDLEIFNDAAVDREITINDHRKEINELLMKLGKEAKYEIVE